jgi:hypothetical protein
MSIGAMNMHSVQVKCEVEADPSDSVRFSWTYNNTRNVSPVSREFIKIKEFLIMILSIKIFYRC